MTKRLVKIQKYTPHKIFRFLLELDTQKQISCLKKQLDVNYVSTFDFFEVNENCLINDLIELSSVICVYDDEFVKIYGDDLEFAASSYKHFLILKTKKMHASGNFKDEFDNRNDNSDLNKRAYLNKREKVNNKKYKMQSENVEEKQAEQIYEEKYNNCIDSEKNQKQEEVIDKEIKKEINNSKLPKLNLNNKAKDFKMNLKPLAPKKKETLFFDF